MELEKGGDMPIEEIFATNNRNIILMMTQHLGMYSAMLSNEPQPTMTVDDLKRVLSDIASSGTEVFMFSDYQRQGEEQGLMESGVDHFIAETYNRVCYRIVEVGLEILEDHFGLDADEVDRISEQMKEEALAYSVEQLEKADIPVLIFTADEEDEGK